MEDNEPLSSSPSSFNYSDYQQAMIQRLERLDLGAPWSTIKHNPYVHIPPSNNTGGNAFQDMGSNNRNGMPMHHHQVQHPFHARPYGAMGTLPFNGDNAALIAESRKAIASMILDLMTREDGCARLAELWESFFYMKQVLVLAITEYGEGLVVRAAKDSNGIKSVKLLIKLVQDSYELCEHVTSALQHDVLELMMHPNGPQLVVHCLQTLEYEQNMFLFDAACKSCLKLAKNAHGSACLKECILASRYPHRQRILSVVVDHSVTLAQQSKGNYIVQLVLKLGERHFSREICLKLQDQLEELSQHQHGGYVIEEAIKSSGGQVLIRELARFSKQQLECLATDPCGNFVLQTALKRSKRTEYHNELVRAINGLASDLQEDDFYARKVLKLAQAFWRRSFDC